MSPSAGLRRVVGIPGAIAMGLGSIVGTGIFVSIGLAAEIAGAAVLLAVVLAACIAAANGLSSAQLAAAHPVSGGTYEYGHRYLSPAWGFTAGWMFLCAKSASAAAAALALAAHVLQRLGHDGALSRSALALGVVALLTFAVAGGMRRSSRINAVIVGTTAVALGALVATGTPVALARGVHPGVLDDLRADSVASLLHATALMFVAYTGYGRIATLGEEIREPSRNIPRAILATLGLSALLYPAVNWVAIATLGAPGLAARTRDTAAPLEAVAAAIAPAWLPTAIAVGAVAAMAGVVLNLQLGESRVVLAMARRGDLPTGLAAVEGAHASPVRAVLATGSAIAVLVAVGDLHAAWSFSAFTVLVYYGITNLAALRLPAHERRFPRAIAVFGLLACLGVAVFIPWHTWLVGVALLGLGALGRRLARRT